MKIRASVENSLNVHHATVATNDNPRPLEIPSRAGGYGSAVNGGELLFLALATCYCNDLYREAAKRGLSLERVEVRVEGDFGAEGEPGTNVTYHTTVTARAPEQEIQALMRDTDRLAEIQNTLRVETPVTLGETRAISV